ncbi:MAG TPA: pyridoxamine 5'-phosphate oxidase family protein [Ktedonobacterales bacterium]|jgi:hypothetical protein
MTHYTLPPRVEEVFREFLSCEFATLGKDGAPIAWPTAPLYLPETGRFLITTSIGAPQKAFNIRRNPHVSLLFSDPTGSGLAQPPIVLVQGDADIPHEVTTWNEDLARFWAVLARRQPSSQAYSSSAIMRAVSAWYYMRLLIYITPRRIRWWPDGNCDHPAQEIEVSHVE